MMALVQALLYPFLLIRSFFSWLPIGAARKGPATRKKSASGRGKTRAELTVVRREDVGEPPPLTPGRQEEGEPNLGPGIVWAGKEMRLPLVNPADKPRWYRVSVTDLDEAHYEIRSPDFGTVDSRRLNRFDPGQQTEFVLLLKDEGEPEPGAPRVFHLYVTAFDRESEDAHQTIVRHNRYQWVPKPKAEDLSVEVQPPKVVMRPWRERVALRVVFTNRSSFPLSATLTFAREDDTGKPLPDDEPTVLEAPAPVAPHQRESWDCIAPPGANPTEPVWVKTTAAAHVTGGKEEFEEFADLPANQTVQVLWFKLFGLFRDWCAVVGILLGLIWLFWGVPVWWVRPAVRLTLNFEGTSAPGELPPEVTPEDLEVGLQAWDTRRQVPRKPVMKGKPIKDPRSRKERYYYSVPWPKQRLLFGFRWLWPRHVGWNGYSRREMPFLLQLKSKKAAFDAHDLEAVSEGVLDVSRRPVFRRWWITSLTEKVPYKTGAVVEVEFVLGDVTRADKEIRVTPAVDGTEASARTQMVSDGRAAKLLIPLTTRVPEGKQCSIVLTGTAMPSGKTVTTMLPKIERRKDPWPARLDFKAEPDVAKLSIPAAKPSPVPFRYEVYDAKDGTLLKRGGSQGDATIAEVPVTAAEQAVTVKIIVPDDSTLPVPSSNVTLSLAKAAEFPEWTAAPNPDKPKAAPPSGAAKGAVPPPLPPAPLPLVPLPLPQKAQEPAGRQELPQPVRPAP